MYQALYRKWRPRIFDDVVGQEHITATLKNEIAAGRPSHAYLFCGTRGTGKTSCSKILAKAVNCLNQKDGNPCGECEICKGIDEDSILDVTEIDAASNSGVDNIRDLREEAYFLPTAGKYRVYIIDEAHMLSTGAFNALLKIMEEPPAHVIFILATTEIHKVPATILSRCQRFDFKRIAGDTIRDRLSYIAREEGVRLDEDAAVLIARLSDGGMRDALSLLDLCLTNSETVTVGTVSDCAGLVGQEHLFAIARAVSNGDGGGALAVLESLWEKSVDYQRLCEQLIVFYRNLMVAKSVSKPEELIVCLPAELEEYKRMAGEESIQLLFYRISTLQDTLSRMGKTSMRRAELEMGLIKLASPQLGDSGETLASRVEKLELQMKNAAAAHTRIPPQKENAERAASVGQAAESKSPAPTADEIRKTPVEPFEQWEDVLTLLKDKNAALYGALVNSSAYTGGELLLVDAGGSMFADMMRKDSYAKESLRETVSAVTGRKYRLGPYDPVQYAVKENEPDKLEEIMKKADRLGADVQVSG